MWFATSSGLNKYDGYSFTVYNHRPGDPASLDFDDLEVVFEDSDGNIWVGGADGIDRFDRQTATFTRVDERGQAFCIAEDQDGTLWAGFWHGLYGYDRDTLEMIYAYPRSSGPTDDPNALADGQVRSIVGDSRGYLWIGTSAGLDRLDRKTGTFIHYRADPDDPRGLSHGEIIAIFEDRRGILWFGTGGGGLNRLNRTTGIFQRYQHDPVTRQQYPLQAGGFQPRRGDCAGAGHARSGPACPGPPPRFLLGANGWRSPDLCHGH